MPKISQYTEQTAPNEDSYFILSYNGYTYKARIRHTASSPYHSYSKAFSQDFLGDVSVPPCPFSKASVNTGTIASIASIANHPGIQRLSSSASASSGHQIGIITSPDALLLQGGEVAEYILRVVNTASLFLVAGFHDNDNIGTPTDGAWFELSGTTLNGKTANNSTISTTSSSYVITANTWYRLKVEVSTGASLVTFTLYDSSGVVLWTDSLSSNIPTAAGRETDMKLGAIWTAASATALVDVDWMAFYKYEQLAR